MYGKAYQKPCSRVTETCLISYVSLIVFYGIFIFYLLEKYI